MRRRTFKEPALQAAYDWFREHRPGPEAKGKGGAHNAYCVGRYVAGADRRPFAVRGSIAYAAWAAGIDDARQDIHERTAP